ncbi:MAG: hypothetical protein ACLP9K_05545 [Nitrososphaerales archaeon]
MKYLQESRKSIFAASLLGAILVIVPIASMVVPVALATCGGPFPTPSPCTWTGPKFVLTTSGQGKQVNAINNANNTLFYLNSSTIGYFNGTSYYNIMGSGGNDTFFLAAGNDSTVFVATGSALLNNSFDINSTGGGNSTFSMISGGNVTFPSTFSITQGNLVTNPYNATQYFMITSGAGTILNENSTAPVGNSYYSLNLGTNSSVNLGSDFQGNGTEFNVVF